MGYAEALLARDYGREERSLQKKAKRKGLWGSVGRTLGGLAATVLTGGAAAPWAVGLAAGAGTFAGGALGAAASREKLKGGTFMQEDRASLERELGAFGERNIVGGLKAGVTAGIGQKLKLAKEASAAKAATPGMADEAVKAMKRGKGFDFGESALGRGLGKSTGFTGTGGGTGIKTSAQSIEQIAPDYSEQLHAGTAEPFSTFKEKEVSGGMYTDGEWIGSASEPGPSLWSKFKGHVSKGLEETGGEFSFKNIKDVGDYGKAVVGTAQYRIGQGLEEGAKYNQEIPWDQQVVLREKDISVGRTSGKSIFDWPQLGDR